jgi:hypothetical protein
MLITPEEPPEARRGCPSVKKVILERKNSVSIHVQKIPM